MKTKYAINLDSKFNPFKYGNEIILDIEQFKFEGGEQHIKIDPSYQAGDMTHNATKDEVIGDVIISQRFNSSEDIIAIMLANDALRRLGFKNISLFLPYFPAARQDRVCNEGEPLSVKVFADMINSCGFDKVTILSPHSEVAPALLNNVEVLDELKIIGLITSIEYFVGGVGINIVCPDAGAGKRVNKVAKYLAGKGFDVNLIRCEKVRDVSTGKITEFFVSDKDLGGLNTLIVDDINSMGGTFIGLGKELRKRNCGKLMLFTSHSDCYKGIKNVTEHFDMVYTTNSKRNWGDDYYFPLESKFECIPIHR
tara:strand:- start:8929 stop:9858 length:930 start_codon:yes stop_codon:yes gene_type:complete